ncbi:MAG TPA: aminoglycoside adenylyltransferase domain-containing protein [Cryptosporangiaceae bacterium]|nr:aminoglycoside adenylyltransferase domain-containing protein [Cryptosporangiaceae bacterium]
MNHSGSGRYPSPTRFPELDELLWELTERVADILGDNFVGANLQGSFAVGDADMQSDCDFLVPVAGPITREQEAGLRAFHDEVPTRPGYWTQRLEGSYPVREELRTLDGLGRPWLYVDNGWRTMQWSTHCNTEVVRWSLRECGVTLAGPPPKDLVDPVPPEVLRAAMRECARRFLPDLLSWATFDIAWTQRYAVTTLCRILHTHDQGRVTSKKAALLWAEDRVDPRWSELVQQVLGDRELGWDPDEPPRAGSVERTVAFVEYVRRRVGVHRSRPDDSDRENGSATG